MLPTLRVTHVAAWVAARESISSTCRQRFEKVAPQPDGKAPRRKRHTLVAILLTLVLADVAERATPASTAPGPHTVVIETFGNIPGFTQAQLAAYLALRMHDETPTPWEFLAGQPGAAPAPNRVVWSFKTLRTEWKGGSHKGFPSPSNSVTYLSAEVKMYLNNTYQMTTSIRPSVRGQSDDRALAEMVHNVARSLFVENKPDIR
jgi:hypothetical protein